MPRGRGPQSGGWGCGRGFKYRAVRLHTLAQDVPVPGVNTVTFPCTAPDPHGLIASSATGVAAAAIRDPPAAL